MNQYDRGYQDGLNEALARIEIVKAPFGKIIDDKSRPIEEQCDAAMSLEGLDKAMDLIKEAGK